MFDKETTRPIKNLILLYTGNVGSTPTMHFLKQCGYFVPFREHMDEYKLKSMGSDVSHEGLNFLRHVIEAKQYEERYKNYAALSDTEIIDRMPVAFKWRPHPRSNSSDALRAYFQRLNLEPFFMFRRSVVEQAIKVKLNQIFFQTKNPQFITERLPHDEYLELKQSAAEFQHAFSATEIDEIGEDVDKWIERTVRLLRLSQIFFPSKKPPILFAEEVISGSYNHAKAQQFFSSKLGVNLEPPKKITERTKKLGFRVEQALNSEDVLGRFDGRQRKYTNAIQGAMAIS